MGLPQNNFSSRGFLVVAFILSIVAWLYAFRSFLTTEAPLVGDAISYYEHTRTLIYHLSNGIFAMWDPIRLSGTPTEFFYRRIGEVNPFYMLILLFVKIGVSFDTAYFTFLAGYYFLGMFGFYYIAKRLFSHTYLAFCAYLLLMSSSLATTLFGSFVMLVLTPSIWFFFFLLDFYTTPNKRSFLGMTICLMIIAITYIPFYFLTTLIVFIFCFSLFYFSCIPRALYIFFGFIARNKWFSLMCVLFLLLAIVPGLLFYVQGYQSELVLPVRTHNALSTHMAEVGLQSNAVGGIATQNILKDLFTNYESMLLGKVYISIWVHLLFLLGLIAAKRSPRLMLLALWGVIIYWISLYDATPIYKFLYEHILFFKYFRNFQFFIWLTLLPVYVLVCVEHLKLILEEFEEKKIKPPIYGLLVFLAHLGFGVILFKSHAGICEWMICGLSVLFFLNVFSGFKLIKHQWLYFFLLLLIGIQPLIVYAHLDKNSHTRDSLFKEFTIDDMPLLLSKERVDYFLERKSKDYQTYVSQLTEKRANQVYVGLKSFVELYHNINPFILDEYLRYKIILYDNVEIIQEETFDLNRLAKTMAQNTNLAFIKDVGQGGVISAIDKNASETFQIIHTDSREVRVSKYTGNRLSLKTDLLKNKFLVFNDNDHKGRTAYINGQHVPIWKTNMSFKGVWVPMGTHNVEFVYGSPIRVVFNVVLMLIMAGTLGGVFYLSGRKRTELG